MLFTLTEMESKLAQDPHPNNCNNHQTSKCKAKVPLRFRHQIMCQSKFNLGPKLMRMSTNKHLRSISISVWIENQVSSKMVLQLSKRQPRQTTFSAHWNKNGPGKCSARPASRCKELNLISLIKIYKSSTSNHWIVMKTIQLLLANKITSQKEDRCSRTHQQRKRTLWPSRSKNCNLT